MDSSAAGRPVFVVERQMETPDDDPLAPMLPDQGVGS
jgi:hypothetical protein